MGRYSTCPMNKVYEAFEGTSEKYFESMATDCILQSVATNPLPQI